MDHAAEEHLNELARQRERQGWMRRERPQDHPRPGNQMDRASEDRSDRWARRQEHLDRLWLERPPKKNPRRWVHATESPSSLYAMAVFYLKVYDYKSAHRWDRKPEFTLVKVVCNLRKYYLQSKEATIDLVRTFFNPRSGFNWTAEGIGLAWDIVEPYAPSMGLKDDTVVNRERAAELYDLVVDLILMLEPKGRVLAADLYQYFLATNPDLDPVPTDVAFGIAVGDVTGKVSASSKGKKYYSGFRLPASRRPPSFDMVREHTIPVRFPWVHFGACTPKPKTNKPALGAGLSW